MQMKHLLVALLVLLALVGTAVAADSVEVRSEVLDITGLPATISTIILDETSWAGFYYNIDDDVATESMQMMYDSNDKLTIVYTTTPEFQAYDYDFGGLGLGYAVIGFFAEPYVALGKNTTDLATFAADAKANKIAKLVLDTDERYILKTGSTLELGDGYSLIVDQIDVDGNKAYIKFMKDGKEINSSIITTGTGGNGEWAYTLKVLNEADRQVMRMHVRSVFQGTESSLVEIEGLWLVDYLNAIEVKSDTDYGKWEADSIGTGSLSYKVDAISVNNDEDLDLGKGIFLKTGNNFTNSGHPMEGMFYLYKVYTDAGTYNIRSTVYDLTVSGVGGLPAQYDYSNFAAFYFDINTGIETETLDLKADTVHTGKYVIEYVTIPKLVFYDFTLTGTSWDSEYYVMGLFGEKFVPVNTVSSDIVTGVKPDKIAKLVIDSDERYILKTGATLELGDGYSLVVDQIDVDGNKAYIRFMYNGQEINSSIVTTGTASTTDNSWVFDATVLNEKNTQIMRVHVRSVFQGTQDSLVEIDGLWLMDYKNIKELKSGDKYGLLEYDGAGQFSGDDISLNADDDKVVANNMSIKVADGGDRFYFYVAAEVGEGSGPEQPPIDTTPEQPPVTPPVDEPKDPEVKPPVEDDKPTTTEKTFWQKYMWHIIIAIVLIIIIAGAAYYFLVMKKQ